MRLSEILQYAQRHRPIRDEVSYSPLIDTGMVKVLSMPPPSFFPPFSDVEATERQSFADAERIFLLMKDHCKGLGDHWITLQQLYGFARHFPEKQFYAHPILGASDFPFLEPLPNLSFRDPSQSCLSLHFNRKYSALLYKGGNVPQGFNHNDYNVLRAIQYFGVTPDMIKYYRSVLKIDPKKLRDLPVKYDLIIFPDAKEFEMPGKDRSVKSLPVSIWSEIFSLLPRHLRLAVVMGTCHRSYCDAVLKQAKESALSVTAVAGSLERIAEAIVQSKTFVGMDSGTTHLARQVITAASESGREIAFRQVFNEAFATFTHYGLAHPSLMFPALVKTNSCTHDLIITPADIVDFILSDDITVGQRAAVAA